MSAGAVMKPKGDLLETALSMTMVRRRIMSASKGSGIAGRGESRPSARASHFSSDQGARPQEYRGYFEVLQRRAGGKGDILGYHLGKGTIMTASKSDLTLHSSIPELAANVATVVATDRRVMAVYLFGSRARRKASASSDVDLGVLFGEPVEVRDLVLLESELEEHLGRSVDLVNLGSCRTFLAVEIIDGERIFCSNPLASDRFELYVLAKAGDLARFERERRARVLIPSGVSS